VPQVLLGNSGFMNVTEPEIEKYFINKMFQVMTQALYFGLDRETIQEITNEALARSEKYIVSVGEKDKVLAQ
jgi:hypothetical protein